MEKILIIDDDPDICTLLKRFLTRKGYEVITASNGVAGIRMVEAGNPGLVLTDFRLGDMDGSDVLQQLREKWPHIPVLVMTGYSDIRMAVNVMKQGAFDYITKPIIPEEILFSIQRALSSSPTAGTSPEPVEEETVQEAIKVVKNKSATSGNGKDYVIGRSLQAQALYKQIDLVAPTNYTVIVYGESGAGKESIARMIHDRSPRRRQPFVAMDCGAISKDLANSELFGHEKGSFTGALGLKIGHFELANGGTLFLDEVTNLPYDVQSALLRVVQERALKRIGGTKEIPLDVRILIASNERLLTACHNGRFREDLYHRFNEFSLEIPPLRERQDDIMLFAETFLKQAASELGKPVQGFTDDVVKIFLHYPWYGNVRELKNVVKRATLLTDGMLVEAKSLPFEIAHFAKLGLDEITESEAEISPRQEHANNTISPSFPSGPPTVVPLNTIPDKADLKAVANNAEYEMIMRVLHSARYNKSKAAQLLGIDRKTLYNKLKNYSIE